MWSASMLVTTASTGCRCRKLAFDSSGSTTMKSPAPRRAFDPAAFSRPPITKCGSSPPSGGALAQSGGRRVRAEVRAAPLEAEVPRPLGDAAHTRAADADKVDMPDLVLHR